MNCPYCGSSQTRVAETRDVMSGKQKRRYRKCMSCGERFVIYEKVDEKMSIKDRYGLVERLTKYHDGAVIGFSTETRKLFDAYFKGVVAEITYDPRDEDIKL